MTQKELNLRFQELKVEYTKKSHKIAQQKQDEDAKKQDALLAADDAFHKEKRERIAKITKLRIEKAALFDGDPKRAILEAEARNLESEISVLRDDNERRKRTICHEFYANIRAFDEQSRLVTEWYEYEKQQLMKEYNKDGYLTD